MADRAAIGFRAHSGWAAAVAIGGPLQAPVAVKRRRISMLDGATGGVAQPYHAAAKAELPDAGRIVGECARSAAALAGSELRSLVEDLRGMDYRVAGCSLLLASGRPLPALGAILASHAMIHTAEGELFREALRAAARSCGLAVTEVKERELFARAAAQLGLPENQLHAQLAQMGRDIGPPWRQDQKFAALAAWMALAH